MSGDPEVLPFLIRGVGARLDVATRETRLQGMRVGEAVAALSGQELRFAELDAERREEAEEDSSGSRLPAPRTAGECEPGERWRRSGSPGGGGGGCVGGICAW